MGDVIEGKFGDKADVERQVEAQMEAQRRAQNCAIDIKNVLAKWDCLIDPMIQLSGQDIRTTYRIIPRVKVKM